MATSQSFAHRQNEKSFAHKEIAKFEFKYTPHQLQDMLHDFPIFCEMGGLYGLCNALRTDTSTGILADELRYTEEIGADGVKQTIINWEESYEARVKQYGRNRFELPPLKSIFEYMWEGLQDEMLMILIAAGIVSIVAHSIQHPENGWIDGVAVLFAVVLVVLVGSVNNYTQAKSFRAMAESLKGSKYEVLRGVLPSCKDAVSSLDASELLVGDIVKLGPGNMIPADGVLVTNSSIVVNESSVTGESKPLTKSFYKPFFISGTEVITGSGYFLVTSVGEFSAKGKLMKSMSQEDEATPLQERLEAIAEIVGKVGLSTALALYAVLFIRWAVDGGFVNFSTRWPKLIEFFIDSVTIIVVAVPEGLPLAVTVSLAYSLAQMEADYNFVKVLNACETMGNATAICSDKTGTLTQNRMTVTQCFIGGKTYNRQPSKTELTEEMHNLLIDGLLLNSDRKVLKSEMKKKDDNGVDIVPEMWKWEGDGGETDSALLSWITRYHGYDDEKEDDIITIRVENRARIVNFFPFSSVEKYSSVLVLHSKSEESANTSSSSNSSSAVSNSGSKYRQFFKGAGEIILAKCTKVVDEHGQEVDIGSCDLPLCVSPSCKNTAMYGQEKGSPTLCKMHARNMESKEICIGNSAGHKCDRWAVIGEAGGEPLYCHDPSHQPKDVKLVLLDSHPTKLLQNYARSGLRTICIAYCDSVDVEFTDTGVKSTPRKDAVFVFVALAGIKDPLRVQTKKSVRLCQKAGIVVRMVTGDNIDTARFISRDCGILTAPHHIALEGSQLRQAIIDNKLYRENNNGKNDEKFVEMITNLRTVARCLPNDKLELVKFLKELNFIVGVTGDGSNDAPAMKAGDVGLAMGIAGTDVCKAAAKIIIMNDDFFSIVRSVVWGRSVYDNIRKFLQFQLTVNVVALTLTFASACAGKEEPLSPVQLLWVNLIMDTMGAVALGTEMPSDSLLDRKPYDPEASIISKIMYRNILVQSASQLIVLFVVLYGEKLWDFSKDGNGGVYHHDTHYTFVFNVFVWLQVWNEITCRKVNTEINFFEGFFANFSFTYILLITGFFQALMVEVFGSFAKTYHQTWQLWLWAIFLGSFQVPSGLLSRLFPIDPLEGQIEIDPKVFEGADLQEDNASKGNNEHQNDSNVSGELEMQTVVKPSSKNSQEFFGVSEGYSSAFIMPKMVFTPKEKENVSKDSA